MSSRLRRFARRVKDERGTSLIEVMVAIFILAIAITGIVGSMGSGMTVVSQSRQRSAASAVAKEKIERMYNTRYERVALDTAPVYNADTPDKDVSGTAYTVGGVAEPMVIDPAGGAIPHFEDPVTLGNTEFNIYQYVTWVDDPSVTATTQDYKRIVVVVTWKHPTHTGSANRVVESTFLSEGVAAAPTPTASPTPSPSPSASPTPTPPPPFAPVDPLACPGDTDGPVGTQELLSGTGAQAGYTNSTTIQVRLTATDACTAASMVGALSNDGTNFTELTALTNDVPAVVPWTVPDGDGSKTITVRFRDAAGNLSATVSKTILLDQTRPTAPTGLTKASPCDRQVRLVTFTWTAAADANLVGYRVYRKGIAVPPTGQGLNDYFQIKTVSGLSTSDTHEKNNDVYFKVTSYDKAGNESVLTSSDTDALLYQRNSCA